MWNASILEGKEQNVKCLSISICSTGLWSETTPVDKEAKCVFFFISLCMIGHVYVAFNLYEDMNNASFALVPCPMALIVDNN